MKKIIYLLIAVFAVTACQKEPDFDELSEEYLVFTSYDNGYSFSTPTTIFVPNSIVLLGTSQGESPEWSDANAQKILTEFVTNFTTAGYTVTRNATAAADLKLNVSFIEDVTYFITYDYPYWWWWDYYWPGWYYPYPLVYGYAVGSLISELVVPGVEANPSGQKLPTEWYSYISGEEYGNKDMVTPYIVRGVDNAFKQSPYLKK